MCVFFERLILFAYNKLLFILFCAGMIANDGTIWNTRVNSTNSDQATPTFKPKQGIFVENLETIDSFFCHFIDGFIIDQTVRCTNKRLPIDAETKPITKVELYGFIGFLLLLGVTKKHDVEINEVFRVSSVNHMDWATVCMSRDRFNLISAHICFDDVATRLHRHIACTKLFKISEIFDRFKKNCKSGMIPGSNTCIDEQLYSYRGRCAFKQYIPSKPAKYGIKLWSHVDVQSGYLLDTNIYAGNYFN